MSIKMNELGGAPSNQPCQAGTIRMTVQVEIPYKNEIMNYNDLSKQAFRDFVNSNDFGGMSIEARGYESAND